MFAHYIYAFLLIYYITPCQSSGRFFRATRYVQDAFHMLTYGFWVFSYVNSMQIYAGRFSHADVWLQDGR